MKRIFVVGMHPSATRLARDLRVAAGAVADLQVRKLTLRQLTSQRLADNLQAAPGENHLVWFRFDERMGRIEAAEKLFKKIYVVPADSGFDLVEGLFVALFEELIKL